MTDDRRELVVFAVAVILAAAVAAGLFFVFMEAVVV